MKRTFRAIVLVIGTALMTNAHAGFLVANNDEWTLSDQGFNAAPATGAFINNVTNLFTGDQAGNFLAYSNNFGLTGTSLKNAVEGAGHTWTAATTVTFDVATLNNYDGIFLGGTPGLANQQVVIDYLLGGGNAYIMAGTGAYGGAAAEAAAWNDVLALGGLQFASNWCCSNVNTAPDDGSHPLLAGVPNLFFDYGNAITDLDTAGTNGEVLFSYNGNGMLALSSFGDLPPDSQYSPVPAPSMIWLFGLGLLLAGARRRVYR